MRGPKEKWERAAAAIDAVLRVIEAMDTRVPANVLAKARETVDGLRDHVDNAEECERD